MNTPKCPRCGQLIPGWQPVHFSCLAYRMRGWLILSSIILLLAGGFLLVRVVEVEGLFEPQETLSAVDDSESSGNPTQAAEVAEEQVGTETPQTPPRPTATMLSTAETTLTLPPSATGTTLRPSPTTTATRLSPARRSTVAPTAEPTSTPEAPRPTATSPAIILQDEIVFESNRDGDYDIYIANIDGSNVRQLTANTADDDNARVSPDGRYIAFASDREGHNDVYVMDRDGGNLRRLTTDLANDRLPAWSPDSTEIAFISDRDGVGDIFIINADGSDLRQVTDTPHREGHMGWSEDGLVFNASLQRYWQLYRSDVDGSNRRALTDSTYDEWSPEWSPDGEWILYLSERDSRTNHGIYLMRADGSDPRVLYNGPDYEWGAVWSADGTQIAFTVQASEGDEAGAAIYLMDADGGNVRRIIDRAAYPSWAVASPGVRNETESPTPRPLATPEPTIAATPLPTNTPSPPPPPPVNCVDVGDRWGPTLWNEHKDRLGCALTQEIRTNAAFQRYQRGLAIWREDVDRVYILYDNGTFSTFPAAGPEGYFDTPLLKGSFGYLWNNNETVRSGLGQPAAAEANALNFAAQDFERGTILYFFENDAFNYVLFADNNRWTSTQE